MLLASPGGPTRASDPRLRAADWFVDLRDDLLQLDNNGAQEVGACSIGPRELGQRPGRGQHIVAMVSLTDQNREKRRSLGLSSSDSAVVIESWESRAHRCTEVGWEQPRSRPRVRSVELSIADRRHPGAGGTRVGRSFVATA